MQRNPCKTPGWGILALLLAISLPVHAECSLDRAHWDKPLTLEARERRDALYLQLCRAAGGTLIDITDPTLAARLERPAPPALPKPGKKYYPFWLRVTGRQGTVTIAFLLATDGSLQSPTILESSGNDSIDAASHRVMADLRYSGPALLDGVPVPVFAYLHIPFVLTR